MVNVQQIIFSLLGWRLPISNVANNTEHGRKSIAIVGAGSAGLAMLKTLLDVPEHSSWDIVLFEQRNDVGGVWLPDPYPEPPPTVPGTALYPGLHTNTPVPLMTYPGFPFPAGTYLYPSHEFMESYLVRYAHHYDLSPYIRLNHQILSSSWSGNTERGVWNITFLNHQNETHHSNFDHLIIATGNNHFPRIQTWPGQDKWLAGANSTSDSKREITHSAWYRHPADYKNKSILVVGSSSSGQDLAAQIAPLASKVYISVRSDHSSTHPLPPTVIPKPVISHFTQQSIVFVDNTEIDVDLVLLATGYEIRKPFLDAGNVLVTDPEARPNKTYGQTLVTNTYYIFPLYRHIFSLSPMYPTTALSFVGLPINIANCPSDIAQSLFVAHSIRDPNILPSRDQMLHDLATQEQRLKEKGLDPNTKGHTMSDRKRANDYQDELVEYLKEKGAIEDNGQKFVEEWRRKVYTYDYLKRGWKRIEALNVGEEWVKDVTTEEEWWDLMQRVNTWQKEYEDSNGIDQ
ncbi:hypothetical protein AX15_000287 [Amanita polypyramis BW_CC]|nr:hypothetical protein AX15_000287 [Amanita polypyramis BW_CC]